ncbi:MAG: hypothetical protein QM655_14190 [Nocardioidaceae bacterium]
MNQRPAPDPEQIVEKVAAIQAAGGFFLTDEDRAAIRRVLSGETIPEQELEQAMAEVASARTGPPPSGPPLNDNLLGLTDAAELHYVERRITSCRIAEMTADPTIVYRKKN